MKQGESYIRHTGDYLAKHKTVGEFLKGAILVTAVVVGFYNNISHSVSVDILKKQYEDYINKKSIFRRYR